jgi:AsmA-like C-terminal region
MLITGAIYFFKDDLINYAITESNKYLKAKVYIAKVDIAFWSSFPAISVDFDNVFIPDTYKNAQKTDTMFYGEKIRLKFNLWDVWNKDYKVKALELKTGNVYLKYNEDGKSNFEVLKESDDTSAAEPFHLALKQVSLQNVRFRYTDQKNEQKYENHFDKLALSGVFADEIFEMSAESNSFLHTVNSGDVRLIKNVPLSFDLTCTVDKKSKSISFPAANVLISQIPLQFKGTIDTNKIDFKLTGKQLPFYDVINKISLKEIESAKKFEGKGSVDFDLSLKGNTQGENKPALKCAIDVRNGSLLEPSSGLRMNDVQLTLNYESDGNSANDQLMVKKLHFQSLKGAFDAKFVVKSFDAPEINGEAKGFLDLAIIHKIFPLVDVRQTSGIVNIDGKADLKMNAAKGMNIRSGEVSVALQNVLLQRNDDSRIFENISGSIDFVESEALLKDVHVKIKSTDLIINGELKNLIGYAKNVEDLKGELTIKSNNINVVEIANTSGKPVDQNERTWSLPENIQLSILVNLQKLNYQDHIFTNIQSNLQIQKRLIDFQQFQASNAGSTVSGRVSILENTPENFILKTNLASPNIGFKSLFQEWNNFDQKVITENNIAGMMEAKLILEAPFDGRIGILKHLMKADVSIKIKNGRLSNVSTFKEIIKNLKTSKAKVLLSQKSIKSLETKLNDINFQTLENTFTVRDGVLQFPKMEIKSSAIDVFVAGVHSFDNQIDYRFDFRFRDLQHKNDSEFGTVEDDGSGMRIFMRMHGKLENPIIEWDKEAKKEDAKQNRQDALNDAKSIFKSEFGIGKKDTTIREYQQKVRVREDIILEYDTKEENPKETPAEKENKLLKKVKDKTNKWKEIKKKEEENGFEIEI